MAKENDLLLNQLQNPMFNAYDFKQVGLDVNNTSLEDKEVYKNLDFVKNNPLLQTEGSFDEAKFDVVYNTALSNYNQMAQNKVGEDIGAHAAFFRDNIYAPVEKRAGIGKVNYEINRVANPLRRQTSVQRIDAVTDNPLSVREIAQTQRVWDDKTQSWQDSPNDGWLANWAHTRVLAQWDEEGDHIDPVTGEVVHHNKGDKKLNDAGTYYYENLNGRSVYGREVLSKFDTLTTDGSAWNKFDIFDSDDKKKSLGGTLIKNAIQVIPAFIPGVAPWYLGMRVGINMAGLFGTLGNLVTGNSTDFFHGIEGYTQSLKTSQSDWVTGGIAGTEAVAPAHAWSLESMIGMAADVFTQLAEQRWMFTYPAKWIKGEEMAKIAMEDKAARAFVDAKKAERLKAYEDLLKLDTLTPEQLAKVAWYKKPDVLIGKLATEQGRNYMALSWAEEQLKHAVTDYQKIGKLLSMSYMTGITVQDAYGQALQEGATPVEAALLTLGYAGAEYALINSDLGRWILPELSQERNTWQQIMKVKASQGLSDDILKSTDKVAKGKFVMNMLKLGRQGALYQYMKAAGKNDFTQAAKITLRGAVSNAMGEGVEETSEELLYDLTKSLYNVYASLSGKDVRLSAFDGGDLGSVFNRYALSFVGGTIGGGLGEALPEYRAASRLHKMSIDEANNQLIQIVKEGRGDEFIKTIEKVTWAPTDVGFDVDENGNFKQVKDKKTSQDAIIKQNMVTQVRMIQQLLNADGALLADEDVMKKISGSDDPAKEIRFAALAQSKIATKYLESYNETLSNLVKDQLELAGLKQVDTDVKEEKAETLEKRQEAITELETRIELEKQKVQEFLDGKQSVNFIKRALFEMTNPLISVFPNTTRTNYLETRYHKKLSELSDDELKEGEKDWEALTEMQGADLALAAFDIFEDANIKASQLIRDHATVYFDKNSAVGLFSDILAGETATLMHDPNLAGEKGNDVVMAQASGYFSGTPETFSFAADPMVKFAATLIARGEKLGLDMSQFNARLSAVQNGLSDGSIKPSQASKEVAEVIFDPATNSGLLADGELKNTLLSDIRTAPFISQKVRDEITNIMNKLNADAYALPGEVWTALNDNRRRSPVTEFLDKFSIATKTVPNPTNISGLLKFLYEQASSAGSSNIMDQFGFGEGIDEQITDALKIIEIAKATVYAARTDSAKIGDAFGYNKTINSIDSNSDLAEIDANTADTIVEEISEVEDELLYYKRIADIVSGNKLTEHEKTGTQVGTLLYKMVIDQFIKPNAFPPDDWNRDSIDKLKADLAESSADFTLLRSLSDDLNQPGEHTVRSLTADEQLEFQRELKLVEKALYEFFQANADNVNNTEKLAKLLSVAHWKSDGKDTSILTKSTQSLPASASIWWLASIAAGNPESFHAAYAKSWDASNGIAPIIGQELATRIAIGALTNGKVFAQFAAAQNLALRQYIEANKDDETIKDNYYNKDGTLDMARVLDSDVSIDFLRTILIDGIAGSGKSKGVLRQILSIISQDKDLSNALLENVWIVHTSKDKAYELAVDLFGKEKADTMKDQLFSHAGLMQTISGVDANGKTWNESTDDDGNVIIDKDALVDDENGVKHYGFGINKSVTKPSLIITDEVSHLSLPSLKLVDDFAEYAGIHHLTFGDFDQSGVSVKLDVGKDKTYYAYANNTNFIRSFKLGQSLRTEHGIKDTNNAKGRELVAYVKGLKDEEAVAETRKIDLQYSLNENLDLAGDKVVEPPKTDAELEQLKAQIKHLLDVTKETQGAKLGYIYDSSADAKVQKLMEEFNDSEEYKGLIDFKKGSAAQGDENPYYVVNMGTDPGKVLMASTIYTALTRAKVGSIIIQNPVMANYIKAQTEFSALPASPKVKLTSKAIENFIAKKRAVYDELYKDAEPIKFSRYTTAKTSTTVTTNTAVEDVDPPTGNPGKGLILVDGEGNKFKVIQYNKDEKGVYSVILENVDTKERTTRSLDDISKLRRVSEEVEQGGSTENPHLSKAGDINNSNPDETQMEHHSFNVDETGMIETDTSYSFGDNVINVDTKKKGAPRLDNVIGLINVLKQAGINKLEGVDIANFDFSKTYDKTSKTGKLLTKCANAVRAIRSIGRYGTSQDQILEQIQTTLYNELGVDASSLFTKDKVVVRFAQKVCQDFGKNGGSRARFTRSAKERVKHLISPKKMDSSELIQNYTVMILINSDGKELMEVPICCDTNPITLAFTEGFGEVKVGDKTVNITKWVTDARERILKDDSIPKENKYSALLVELSTALTTGELSSHPQAKKLYKEISLFRSNASPVGGKLLFLTTTIGGKEEWLLPGRDWDNTGVIVNNDATISAMDFTGRYAHYEGDWITYEDLKARGNVVVSGRLFMTDTEVTFTKKGRQVKILPGKPFFVVSDNLNRSFEANPEAALKALFDDADVSTTFVYTEPSTEPIINWIAQVNRREGNKSTDGLLKTDIGNYATAYRMLSYLVSTDEGKAWVRERFKSLYSDRIEIKPGSKKDPDVLLDELVKLMERFDKVDRNNSGTGNQNALIQELQKTLEEDGKGSPSQFPAIASIGVFADKRNNYARIFERTVRALVLGGKSTINPNALSFAEPNPGDPNVKRFIELVTKAPDSKFKDGKVHCHVEFRSADEGRHAVGGNVVIEVGSKTNIAEPLDPTKTPIYVDAKLDTGVLKTTGNAAKEFDATRSELASYTSVASPSEESKRVAKHTNAYVRDSMKFLTAERPTDSTTPKPTPETSKVEKVQTVLNEWKKKVGEGVELRASAETAIKAALGEYNIDAISAQSLAAVIDTLQSDGTIQILPINGRAGTSSYLFTENDLREHFTNQGLTVNKITFNPKDAVVETTDGKYTVSLVWKDNAVNIAKVLEKPKTPKTSSSTKSGNVTVQIGTESKEVKPDDTINAIIPNAQSLNLLEKRASSIAGVSTLASTIAGVLSKEGTDVKTVEIATQQAVDALIAKYPDLGTDATNITAGQLLELLHSLKANISEDAIQQSRKLGRLARGSQKDLNNLVQTLAEFILNPDSSVNTEEDENACVVPDIRLF